MRAAPRLRGGAAARTASLFVGLAVIGAAIVALLESGLGLAPWDVFHLGLAAHSPLTIGTASIVVGLAVLLVAWALGQRPGFGTLANAVVIGAVVDLLRRVPWVARLSSSGLPVRGGLLLLGVGLFGLGSALYIGAGLGAGPRDSLMLALARRTGVRIAVVRAALEISALAVGWALGGVVGVGTVGAALLLGPAVEASFRLLVRLGVAEPAPSLELAP
ncbi:MAG: membrane protein [Actinomycetota bacterium]|nr:MAG: membrane protein [Actinomycetota bacterium]